jgi:carboxylesterase type B
LLTGFLSLQNQVIPGNAGLMDIVESLKWINKHITSFGGNPKQVTLFGQSAGAAIASYLMLSPLSSGINYNFYTICPWVGALTEPKFKSNDKSQR